MILDNDVKIKVSPVTLQKLKAIGIDANVNEIVVLPIDKIWHGSNIKVNVRCDICDKEKLLQYKSYVKNTRKYNIYCCSNKCSSIKNKKTCLERYGASNYVNTEKAKMTKKIKYGDENFQNVEKIKKTKLSRYGCENYNNKEKAIKTNLERYGVESTLLSEDVREKTRKTNIERYGIDDSRKSEKVKKKRMNTIIKKYGVNYYMQTNEFKLKSIDTCIDRYGFDSPNKSDIIKKKKVQSMLNKYGFISNSMTEESKNKLKKTNLERYGVEYPMQLIEFCEKQQKNSKKIIYFSDSLYYQSSYEKDFLELCQSIGIIDKVTRGPVIKYEINRVKKIHFPDFYISEYNLIVEIKSSYYYNKYLDKNIKKMNASIEIGYNYLYIINRNYELFKEFLKIDKPI
jgi:hypothetical protein